MARVEITLDTLGPTLRMLRLSHGLTLRDLAGRAGLSISFLSDLERGRTQPSLATWKRITEAFSLELIIVLETPTQDMDMPVRNTLVPKGALVLWPEDVEALRAILQMGDPNGAGA